MTKKCFGFVHFMMSVFIFGLVMYWCVRYLFSFPLLCASTFYSLRLPTEYERNGRYEGSRWGKRFLLKIFYRYLPHFCSRGNTLFWTFCIYPCSKWDCLVPPAVCGQEALLLPPAPGSHMRALECCSHLLVEASGPSPTWVLTGVWVLKYAFLGIGTWNCHLKTVTR